MKRDKRVMCLDDGHVFVCCYNLFGCFVRFSSFPRDLFTRLRYQLNSAFRKFTLLPFARTLTPSSAPPPALKYSSFTL